MSKKITLRLDERILKQAKRAALERDQSVSQWVSDLIAESLKKNAEYAAARRHALKVLDRSFDLGGKPLSRDEIYGPRTGLR